MLYELEIIADVSINKGRKISIIKNNKIRKLFDLNAISVEEYLNPKTGKVVSKYSGIYDNTTYYKINKPYEDLKNLVINKSTPVLGFMSKSKTYKDGQKKDYKSR